ncbi:CVNH domain-containing protein [Aspergillus bertholletiae]|uniref:CVNH domain-containing protein n=1 Tax=Aspergillus bertholletiae TaxID=1226010 RepID=A0A5N7B8K3_9EURO|nr:CVNH domain-containing protein [Aspergillus bertholletiae]
MSFHESCQNIRIEVHGDRTVLHAIALDAGGDEHESEIILDDEIGNSDGWFSREDQGFTESAQNIELNFRDDEPWLTADLPAGDGDYRERQGINLAEHIGNNDGQLVWVVSLSVVPFFSSCFIMLIALVPLLQ